MRKAQITGNVVKDAEVFHTQSKVAVNFTVAVNERWKDQAGEKKERTTFVKCVIWCKTPGIAPHIKKGLKVLIEGIPEAEAYIRDGQAISNLKIVVKEIEFLNNPNKTSSTPSQGTTTSPSDANDILTPTPDDDLPF